MHTALVALAAGGLLLAGCSSNSSTPHAQPTNTAPTASPTTSPAPQRYSVTIDPADFSANVTNPWFPLPPGRTLDYRGVTVDGATRDIFHVSDEVQKLNGVPCRVVLDRVYVDGVLSETTRDLYSQDRRGNVWYFGEDTAEIESDGTMVSTEGTWHYGKQGALPGIFMTATPTLGDTHRQEYLAGDAEDFYRVYALSSKVKTPYRSFAAALETREWTPLEPGVLDAKFYVKGIGEVKEVTLKGDKEELALVRITG